LAAIFTVRCSQPPVSHPVIAIAIHGASIATQVATSSAQQGAANIWQWKWRSIPNLCLRLPASFGNQNASGNVDSEVKEHSRLRL
jgi:hypothetical protein